MFLDFTLETSIVTYSGLVHFLNGILAVLLRKSTAPLFDKLMKAWIVSHDPSAYNRVSKTKNFYLMETPNTGWKVTSPKNHIMHRFSNAKAHPTTVKRPQCRTGYGITVRVWRNQPWEVDFRGWRISGRVYICKIYNFISSSWRSLRLDTAWFATIAFYGRVKAQSTSR